MASARAASGGLNDSVMGGV